MVRNLLLIVCLLLVTNLQAEDTQLEDLLRKLYGRESFAKNRYLVGIDYGLVYFGQLDGINITEGWNTELRYGFDRYYPTKDLDIIYYRQETFVLGNVSSRFGLVELDGDIRNEVWYGKLAIKDGYGYDTDYGRFTLNHTTSFGWGQNDYEINNPTFSRADFDENVKQLASYNSSLRVEWENGISLYGTIGERQFYSGSPFINRTASMLIEGSFYILPDLAEDTLIDIFGSWYPWVHRSYNSTISFLFYYMRQHHAADWPFNTGDTQTSALIRIGIDYQIE